MNSSHLYDIDRLVAFRHDMHKHPELGYQEVRTSAKILEYLSSIGVPTENIKRVALTGIVADLIGRAPPSGKPFCVALRADMDALPMKEKNSDLEYQSVTEAAHACGHDLHVASLLGGASLIMEKIDQIPSDKIVRLLFQPDEEGRGGAFPMIQEGALNGVDEVYGYHNAPYAKPGMMFMKSGFLMARSTGIHIDIHGRGGHSSLVDQLNDPLQPACDILLELRNLEKEYKDKQEKFVFCMPYLKSAEASNVIPDKCKLLGTLRSFGDEFTTEFISKLLKIVKDTCFRYSCKPEIRVDYSYPPVFNNEKETEHVIRVGKKVLGEGRVLENFPPAFASEDFSYFLKERPGAFFFLSSKRNEGDGLHTDKFNANDDTIPFASKIWLGLVEDRFGITFN